MMLVVNAGDPIARDEGFLAWLRSHDIVPAVTYRVEIKNDKIKVFQYDVDSEGHKFVSDEDGFPSIKKPFSVPLHEDPPVYQVEVE